MLAAGKHQQRDPGLQLVQGGITLFSISFADMALVSRSTAAKRLTGTYLDAFLVAVNLDCCRSVHERGASSGVLKHIAYLVLVAAHVINPVGHIGTADEYVVRLSDDRLHAAVGDAQHVMGVLQIEPHKGMGLGVGSHAPGRGGIVP